MHYIYEYVSSQNNLYPAHIFDWSLKVINCPSEDYSVGGVSDQVFTFTSDHKIDINNYFLEIDYLQYYIQNMEHINNSDRWKYTCIAGGHTSAPNISSWDAIIPDLTLEQWAEQTMTLNDLFNAIVGWTDTNSLSVNGNYVINSAFGYTGITKRQVMQWIAQLTGGNVAYKEVPEIATDIHQTITRGGSAELILNPSNVKNIVLSDFTVPQIDKIWFGTDSSDVGVSYGSGVQQLSLPYNPLINPEDDSFLQPLYNSIRSHIPVYTPMKVELFNEAYEYELNGSTYTLDFSSANTRSVIEKLSSCDNAILPFSEGMRLRYTDANNNIFIAPIFNYELSPRGVTIECTGNPSREVSNALISNEIAQSGKYNKFKRTLDATVSEISNLNGDVSALQQTAASLTIEVANKVGDDEIISKINQTAETITINANRINMTGYVQFNDLSTSGNTSINGDNLVTGIIKDTQNKNSWNLNTGAFTLTDGSVNIHTSAETNDIIELSANVRQTTATPVTGTVSANMQPTQFEIVRDSTTNGRSRSVTTARMSADSSQPMLGLLYDAYDSNNQLTRKRNTAIRNGSMFISDYFPSQYGNVTPSAELQPDGLSFYLGGSYTTYPNVCRLTGFTKYSSRLTAVAGGACIIGPLVIISLRFDSAYTATNSPLIGTIASDMVPSYVSALSCIDVTNGIANEITEAIPCGINTDGKIYMKKLTNAHTYVVTGCYPYQPL